MCTGEDHSLQACPEFKKRKVEEKRTLLYQLQRCFRCLEKGHKSADCKQDKCECGYDHHKLLCRKRNRSHHVQEEAPALQDLIPQDDQLDGITNYTSMMARGNPLRLADPIQTAEEYFQEKALVITSLNTEKKSEAVSLRYVALVLRNPLNGHWTRVVGLLDDGSNVSLISEKMVQKLGFEGPRKTIHVGGIGGKGVSHQACQVQAQVEHLNGRIRCTTRFTSMPQPVGHLTMTDWAVIKQHWEHLNDVPFPELPADPTVHLLIGNDFGYAHRSIREIWSKDDRVAPVARLTPFGWTATGPIFPREKTNTQERVNVATILETGTPCAINSEDRQALQVMQRGTLQLGNGTYQVPVLWRGNARPGLNAAVAMNDWLM